jgi:hypothetical protein
MPTKYGAFARERLTISTTAVVLTAATYSPASVPAAKSAKISVETNPIRYTLDGSVPLAGSIGHPVAAGAEIVLRSEEEIRAFQAIRTGGSDAFLEVTYFR